MIKIGIRRNVGVQSKLSTVCLIQIIVCVPPSPLLLSECVPFLIDGCGLVTDPR